MMDSYQFPEKWLVAKKKQKKTNKPTNTLKLKKHIWSLNIVQFLNLASDEIMMIWFDKLESYKDKLILF